VSGAVRAVQLLHQLTGAVGCRHGQQPFHAGRRV
jgi:hypothetical protein